MGFSEVEREKLLILARQAIRHYLETGEEPAIIREVDDSEFPEPRGVFVTLRKGGELKGCIGFPLPVMPLGKAIKKAAVAAASSDIRFAPMAPEELPAISIEISVLTEPRAIDAEGPEGYLRKVKIGRDGLIIEFMGYSGLLLPQVPVEQGWDAEQFLDHLCMKAGLPPQTWRRENVRIKSFQAEIISEEK